MLTAEELLLENGYDGVKIFSDYSYDTALIGVSHNNQAIYDYDLMVEWLIDTQNFTIEEAIEWIDYNTFGVLSASPDDPIILFHLMD